LALEIPEAKSQLSQEEMDSVTLLLADTWFQLGRYNDALQLFEEQVAKLEGRQGQLVALGGTIRCNSSLGRFDKLAPALEQIRLALPRLDEKTRKEWEAWINTASKSPKN
jgi:tetratricopeptide (TPR) repeat protein